MIRSSLLAAIILALVPGVANPQDRQAPLLRLDAKTVDRFAARTSAPMASSERLRLNAAVKAAMNFRAGMAGKPEDLLAALNPAERAILQPILAGGPGLARAFFRSSIATVGHARAAGPRFGFYNPLVDSWVILDGARTAGGGIALKKLAVVLGEELAPAPVPKSNRRPPWLLRSDLAMPSSLAIASAANIAAFERAWPPLVKSKTKTPMPKSDPALVLDRMALTGASVRSFLADPNYAAIAKRILAAIEAGDGLALAKMTGRPAADHVAPLQRINTLSAPARRTFEVRGVYRHRSGMMVAFGSPYSGNWLIFADLNTKNSKKPKLSDLVVVDLGQLR